jgi:hypothetical protein
LYPCEATPLVGEATYSYFYSKNNPANSYFYSNNKNSYSLPFNINLKGKLIRISLHAKHEAEKKALAP